MIFLDYFLLCNPFHANAPTLTSNIHVFIDSNCLSFQIIGPERSIFIDIVHFSKQILLLYISHI